MTEINVKVNFCVFEKNITTTTANSTCKINSSQREGKEENQTIIKTLPENQIKNGKNKI
ncbi:unnamed protein product [Meloidogyne enterolobii]|uniref:Uncharacterized protein n=1 Tax=Meloidogyne enterolobii TaxID=390850 RepID=A0ACB0YLU6_MELEN